MRCYKWCASRENRPNGLCRCHTKRRMGVHGRVHPSFGMTPTFQNLTWIWKVGVTPKGHSCPSFFCHDNNKDLKVCFLVTCVRCCLCLPCPMRQDGHGWFVYFRGQIFPRFEFNLTLDHYCNIRNTRWDVHNIAGLRDGIQILNPGGWVIFLPRLYRHNLPCFE